MFEKFKYATDYDLRNLGVPEEKIQPVISYYKTKLVLMAVAGFAIGLLSFMCFLEFVAYFG